MDQIEEKAWDKNISMREIIMGKNHMMKRAVYYCTELSSYL